MSYNNEQQPLSLYIYLSLSLYIYISLNPSLIHAYPVPLPSNDLNQWGEREMSYNNEQQPLVGVTPPQAYPSKDEYPPPGYAAARGLPRVRPIGPKPRNLTGPHLPPGWYYSGGVLSTQSMPFPTYKPQYPENSKKSVGWFSASEDGEKSTVWLFVFFDKCIEWIKSIEWLKSIRWIKSIEWLGWLTRCLMLFGGCCLLKACFPSNEGATSDSNRSGEPPAIQL